MKKTSTIRESRKIEVQYRKSLQVRTDWLAENMKPIIKELERNKERFSTDAPATDLRAMINAARERFKTRFAYAQTARLAKAFYNRINSYNSNKMNSAFNALGIDLKEVMKKDGLKDFANIAIANQVDLITSISDDHFDKIEKIVFNGMQAGEDHNMLAQKIMDATGATARRAKMIARDQTATINGQLSIQRAKNAGITKGIWIKSKFTKTANYTPRKSHIAADGKTFPLDKGLLVDGEYVLPSQPINCTCSMSFVVPD